MIDDADLQQFTWFDDPAKPAHYLTKTELDKLGLKPPANPVGFIYWRKKRKTYYLYDQNAATPKRPVSEAQAAALAKAQEALKTCEVCGIVGERRLQSRLDGLDEHGATKRYRVCWACYVEFYKEYRRIEVQGLRAQAHEWLEDCLILDLETTGLYDADVMQIGIIDHTGAVLMNQLIKPRCEPEQGAIAVHGLTMEHVANAPDLVDVLPALEVIIKGRTVLVYNLKFDQAILKGSLRDRGIEPKPWFKLARWRDLMVPYSDWVGDWSRSRNAYRWQPLGGNHDAVGDCLTALDCLKQMAQFSMYGPLGGDSAVFPEDIADY